MENGFTATGLRDYHEVTMEEGGVKKRRKKASIYPLILKKLTIRIESRFSFHRKNDRNSVLKVYMHHPYLYTPGTNCIFKTVDLPVR